MNPFKYGSVVLGKDFCGRSDLIKQVQGHIESSQNIVVYGERRVGKTSLIYEATRRQKGYRTLQIDLMNIKSVNTLCRKFLSALGAMEQQSGFFERFLKSIPSLRPRSPLIQSPALHRSLWIPRSLYPKRICRKL